MKKLWPHSLITKLFLCYLTIIVLLFVALFFGSATLPLDRPEQAMVSLRRGLLFACFLAAAFGFAVTAVFSRYLAGRVNRLVDFTRQLADGKFSESSFPADGNDEMSLLEQNFTEMSRDIRRHIGDAVAEKEKLQSVLRSMSEGVL